MANVVGSSVNCKIFNFDFVEFLLKDKDANVYTVQQEPPLNSPMEKLSSQGTS
jgi:hypothetical protein